MKNKISVTVSVIAIIISIVAILIPFFCIEPPINWDWYGMVIGILSALVTVLIAFQIWQIIDLDKRIDKKIELAKTDLKTFVENEVKTVKSELDALRNEVWCGFYLEKGIKADTRKSLFWLFQSLEYGVKIKTKHKLAESEEETIQYIIDEMKNAIKKMENEGYNGLEDEAKEQYLQTLADVMKAKPNIDVSSIYNYIRQ